jgi:hypothetical protein
MAFSRTCATYSNVSAPLLATPRQTLGFIGRLPFLFCEKLISCRKKWQKCQMGTWKIFEHFCFGMFLLFRHVPPKVKFLQKPEPTKFSAQMGRFILEKMRGGCRS